MIENIAKPENRESFDRDFTNTARASVIPQNYFFAVTEIGIVPYTVTTFFGIMPLTAMYVYFGDLFRFVPLANIGRALFDHLIGGYLEVSYVVSRPEDIDLK